MKKQITFLLAIFLIVAASCTKDNNDSKNPEPQGCIKESLTKTIVGKWKVKYKNATVEFMSDKTYIDTSKILHECDAGKWDVYNNDKDFELECGGNSINVFTVKSFTCDTVFLSLVESFRLIREK